MSRQARSIHARSTRLAISVRDRAIDVNIDNSLWLIDNSTSRRFATMTFDLHSRIKGQATRHRNPNESLANDPFHGIDGLVASRAIGPFPIECFAHDVYCLPITCTVCVDESGVNSSLLRLFWRKLHCTAAVSAQKGGLVSNFSIIQDISLELRRNIVQVLTDTPDTDFNIGNDVERISLLSPGEDIGNSVVASLYLYHIDIDKYLRNQRPLPDSSADDLFRRPPIPLQLRYLFTPIDASEATNQLLLGRVLQHFHDFPNLSTLADAPIGDSFGGASPELRVRPDMLSLEQLAQMWNAFSAPYRVALSLLVEVVAIDSGQPPVRVTRIDHLVPAVGQKGRGQ